MGQLRRFFSRIARFTRSSATEAELEREVSAHLGVIEDEYRRRGMTDQDARRAARRALGGVDRAKELQRDARSFQWLEDLRRDLRYGLRALVHARGFTTVVLLTLGIGIGATTAMFSVLNAVLIRPSPFRDADRLVYVGVSNQKFADAFVIFGGGVGFAPSNADFADLQRDSTSFSSLMTFSSGNANVTGDGMAELTTASSVSGRYFEILGVPAQLGRTLGPDDERFESEPVAVISHDFWTSRFRRAPDVLDRIINIDGKRHRIVGVMPPRFMYSSLDPTIDAERPSDVWTAMRLSPAQRAERDLSDNSAAIARLRDGVSFEQARAETAALFARYDALRSEEWRGWYVTMDWVRESSIRDIRKPIWLLFGAVSLLLLVACGNAAHLFLTRAIGRSHELDLRAALGAGKGRLVRQLMTEAGLLAVGGALLGLAVSLAGVQLLPLFATADVPRLDETTVDWRVFSFSAALTVLTAGVFGLLPAFAVSRRALAPFMRQAGRAGATVASRRVRHVLIVGQVALALVLLTGASLLVQSYRHVQRLDRGFSAGTLTVKVALTDAYGNQTRRREFQQRLLEGVRTMPGVESAGVVNTLPLSHSGAMSTLEIEGRTALPGEMVDTRAVMGDYFDAIGMTLVRGRLPTDADAQRNASVVVINRAFERRYFPDGDAIGRRIRPSTPDWLEVVGVVADVRHDSLEAAPRPQVYRAAVHPLDNMYLTVRSRRASDSLAPTIRQLVQQMDPALGIGRVMTMGDRVADAMSLRRFQTSVLAAFAIVAVLVATIGLYGLLAFTVRQRTAEIGVRMSLGADSRAILTMVLGQGVRLTLAGIAMGAIGARLATGVMSSMLYGVSPTDPLVFVFAGAAFALVGLLASYIPARRATQIDPVIALRSET